MLASLTVRDVVLIEKAELNFAAGLNVLTGETAAQQQSGYVLDAWDGVDVEGWRKSLDEVATFYFTRLSDSYAARTGRVHHALFVASFSKGFSSSPAAPWAINGRS